MPVISGGPPSAATTQPTIGPGEPSVQAKMQATVQNATNDVDAAKDFFDEKAPKPKPAAKSEDSGKIAGLEREIKSLKEKLNQVKTQQKVDLQHAKQKAVEKSEEMVSQKLKACKDVYEAEFEFLANEFEVIQTENDRLSEKWKQI